MTPEAELGAHAQRVGHSISIHYPDLPRFAEYQASAGPVWQGSKWGVEGWTGYGWVSEKLPDAAGNTFEAAMPKGVPLPTEEDGKKKKNKNKKGDGVDDRGDEDEEEAK